jgi:hypothetical protein
MSPMTTDRSRRIVICAIACDEAPFVDGFVQTAREHAEGVLVGDTGSVDGTPERLRHAGATVLEVPRSVLLGGGFAAARNYVLHRVPPTAAFVHWLDLDERITVEGPRLPERHPYGDVTTRTYAFDGEVGIASWRSVLGRASSDEGHTRIHRHDAGVRWAGLVHEELWGSWHRRERVGVTHHHLTHFRDAERQARRRGLYAFLLWRGLTVPALRRGTNPWWFNERVRRLGPDGLAAERDAARQFYDANRGAIDFDVDWRMPRAPWWRLGPRLRSRVVEPR